MSTCSIPRLASLGVLLIGCTAGRPRTEPLPDHLTFVLAHVDIPHEINFYRDRPDPAPGFDLDETFGGSCGAIDTRSSISGAYGVDNQLSLVLSTLLDIGYMESESRTFQAAVDEQVADGSALVVFDVTDIDDGWNDEFVLVRVVTATPLVALPTTPNGWLAADAELRVTRVLGTPHGRIEEGRITLTLDAFPLPIGRLLGIADLSDVEIGAEISRRSLTLGELGGRVSSERVSEIARFFDGSLTDAAVESWTMPDLDPDPAGHCLSESVGVGFDAVPATLIE